MSKSNSTLRHISHRLDVYNFIFIPTPLSRTQHTNFTHIRRGETGLKLASQLIKQIWKLIYRQCLHHSQIKHAREALDDNTKELVLNSEITYKHKRGQDTLLRQYVPYLNTSLSTILDTSITERKNWYRLINTSK